MNEIELKDSIKDTFMICDYIDKRGFNDSSYSLRQLVVYDIYQFIMTISKENGYDRYTKFRNNYLRDAFFDITKMNNKNISAYHYFYEADTKHIKDNDLSTTSYYKRLFINISKLYTGIEIDNNKLVDYLNNIKVIGKDIIDYQIDNNIKTEEAFKEVEIVNKNIDEYMKELNELVGLETVKKQVRSLINLVQINKKRKERGLPTPISSQHLVFTGNPGTGKTTVARILGNIYKEIGVLTKGQLVEVDRSQLVAGYIGHTATKTKEVIDKSLGGILFIDEAYTLAGKGENDFGQESIDTLLKEMEDHRDDLIVIVAGYPDLMKTFINSNPGLKSRFNNYIQFEDYNPQELFDIFNLLCKKNQMIISDDCIDYLHDYFTNLYNNRDEQFANGRDVRNYFEKLLVEQANRVNELEECTDEDLQTFTIEDFKNVIV